VAELLAQFFQLCSLIRLEAFDLFIEAVFE
jgi:hypothetical protein